MLAGILQIRSPSGSNGWYIPKINPGIKKQPVSTSCSFYLVFSNLICDEKENIHEIQYINSVAYKSTDNSD